MPTPQPKTGEIVYFYYDRAEKKKYAIVLEPKSRHKNKKTANAVILTTQGTDRPHKNDYLLPIEESPDNKPTKAICDQPLPIIKNAILGTKGQVSEESLKEIRKKTAKALGITYDDIAS
ncbi:unnamed protein product [marine sediment metagenome]|uniref:PemK-like protein n=1 Tax=marine sediment metagenome TaxID=412755 RepID=X0TAA5_9ZZZZ